MPPIACPHVPRLPFTSPNTWCSSTYAEPGEDLAGALGEQIQQVAPHGERQPLQAASDLPCPQPIARAASDVRRRLEEERAQHAGNPVEHCVIGRERRRVLGREAPDLGLRRGQAATDLEVIPVGERKKIGERALDDGQSVRREIEIADHLGIQQADRVARGRIAKARMEFFGNCGPADDAPALENRHLQPAGGEIARAGEAIVAAADDHGVVAG